MWPGHHHIVLQPIGITFSEQTISRLRPHWPDFYQFRLSSFFEAWTYIRACLQLFKLLTVTAIFIPVSLAIFYFFQYPKNIKKNTVLNNYLQPLVIKINIFDTKIYVFRRFTEYALAPMPKKKKTLRFHPIPKISHSQNIPKQIHFRVKMKL